MEPEPQSCNQGQNWKAIRARATKLLSEPKPECCDQSQSRKATMRAKAPKLLSKPKPQGCYGSQSLKPAIGARVIKVASEDSFPKSFMQSSEFRKGRKEKVKSLALKRFQLRSNKAKRAFVRE